MKYEPKSVVNLLNAHPLAGKHLAQIDPAGLEADAAASGDDDALVVERIVEVGQPIIGIAC